MRYDIDLIISELKRDLEKDDILVGEIEDNIQTLINEIYRLRLVIEALK